MKLIDKDALIAEIDKRIIDAPIDYIGHQRVWAYNDVKVILNTLEENENNELLFRHLSMALPYELRVEVEYSDEHGSSIRDNCCKEGVAILNPLILDLFSKQEIRIKPYLRPMSSMTEEEWKEYKGIDDRSYSCPMDYAHIPASDRIDWLNAHHFDYRGLIPKGLAIEVTEENNPYKIAEE